jgi:hypothetical protein
VTLAAALALAGAAEPPAPEFAWRRVEGIASDDEPRALALAPDGARLAVGGERGAWLGNPGGSFARVLRRGPVNDLAFAPDGALLAATDYGLYRVDAGGRVELRSPGIGAPARAIARIASAGGAVALATGDGVFVSRDARRWARLPGALPTGAASLVALRGAGGNLECWAAVGGELWRAGVPASEMDLGAAPAVRERLPGADADDLVDLVFDLPGADAVALLPDRLVVRRPGSGDWQMLRLALPPGALARRLAFAAGGLWLATDRALLRADELAGPWRRAASPAGSSPAAALAASGPALFAATPVGLLEGRSRAPERVADASSAASSAEWSLREPSVQHLHQVALAYLTLDPERLAGLRRGLARRGWLPRVALAASHASAWDRGWDHDESIVSGALHRLADRDGQRAGDWETSVSFTWELGDLAFHSEAIDVSREAREVIELRDDVLDEITQLYFERQRVLAELAAGDPQAPEARRLRLRAEELAAGIDAWTGGWFSRELSLFAP